MKFLFDEEFVLVGKGMNVVATDKGNFAIDSDSKHGNYPYVLIKEISNANNFKLEGNKLTKSVFDSVIEILNNTKVRKMNDINKDEAVKDEKSKLDVKLEEIVKTAFSKGEVVDNDILIQFVTAGVGFKQAAQKFKTICESLGLRVSAKERQEKANLILKGAKKESFKDWATVIKASTAIAGDIKDTTEAQAIACIRKFAKDNEFELPEKPKGSSGVRKSSGFKSKAEAWLLENANCTQNELKKFLKDNEQRDVYAAHYWGVVEFARKFAIAHKPNA